MYRVQLKQNNRKRVSSNLQQLSDYLEQRGKNVTSVSRSGRWQLTLTVSAEEVQLSCKTHVYLESLCGKPSCNTCRLLFFLCPGEACLCQKLQKDVSSSERRKLPAYAMKKAERYCDIMSTDAVPGGDTEMDFVVFSIRNLAM
ncbi:uncharacterized protein LOC111265519 [Varroa jacobsoni]|uniref:uncharacterized protein LOC111265519 n=1 Tax=Varroa jacobsoni TaxID=62625 RepID=UPI000BF5A1B4|nr:uncharacterized protein LOC111265519 [Varroa jacobsoni]